MPFKAAAMSASLQNGLHSTSKFFRGLYAHDERCASAQRPSIQILNEGSMEQ